MKRLLLTLSFLIGLGLPQAEAQRAPEKAEIIAILGQLYAVPGMRAEMARAGFEGENLDLAMGQIKTVLGDRQIAGYLADRLIALGQGRPESAALATGLIEPLLDRGLSHLSARELAYFYQVETAVVNAMPKRLCGMAFRNRLGPKALTQSTAKVAARLNSPALKAYYRIQYKAAKLGLTRGPKRLSAAARAKAERSIFDALTAKAAGEKNGARLLQAFAQLERANNTLACDAGRMFLTTVMEMAPRARHEALVYMTSAAEG